MRKLRLDADVAPGDRVPRVCLHADEPGCVPALAVGVVEYRDAFPFASLEVGEEHCVVIALHNN